MQDYIVYLKSDYSLNVTAHSFTVDKTAGNKNKVTFLKGEDAPDEDIVVKEVLLIMPNSSSENKEFRVYFRENRFFDLNADHFKVWSEDTISFRDAQDKHLSDIFVDYSQVVAILPQQ